MKRHVILEYGNACPHTTQLTSWKNEKYCWEVLPHPPYTLDLAPSDSHLFEPLKDHMGGQHYKNNKGIQQSVYMVAKYRNRFLLQWHIEACAALEEMPGSFWGFCGILIGYLQ
jgi:hypothetical protein